MKVAVIGSNGQLGTDLCKSLSVSHEVIGLQHGDIEITSSDSVKGALEAIRPQIVLNTAAYHNVPKCEEHPLDAFEVNGMGALNLALMAEDLDYTLVHFSTDYVFDGEKRAPYVETDRPNPLNIYGLTKLSGEHLVLNNSARCFVVRVSGIYGKTPCRAKGGNFVSTMIKVSREQPVVRVVDDEILTPTPTAVIADNMIVLIESEAFGLYHMSCQGSCSWYEFARVIFDELKLGTPLQPCHVSEFPTGVRRPVYSVLGNERLGANGLDRMSSWRDGLIRFLRTDAVQ